MAMKKGEPILIARLTPLSARGWTVLFSGVLLLCCLILASCGDDEPDVRFQPRPEPETPPWFFGVWGTSTTNIYVAGQPGLIIRFDGSSWTKMNVPTQQPLKDIWGRGASDIFACGDKGTILRNTGGGWTAMSSGTNKDLYSIGEFIGGTVYCAGYEGTLKRLSGGSWVEAGTFIIQRNEAGDAFIDTLNRLEDLETLTQVSRYAIGGDRGRLLMSDPTYDWQLRLITGGLEFITSSWSDGGEILNNMVATERGRLFHLREIEGRLSWRELDWPEPPEHAVYGIWVDPITRNAYFTNSEGQVFLRTIDTKSHGELTLLYDGPSILYDMIGFTDGTNINIYAVGIDATVVHYDGTDWEIVQEVRDLLDVKSAKSFPLTDKFGRSFD
jgi:hypothetical protein